jgi:hypothetical protein
MAGVLVVTFVVALRWVPRGRVQEADDEPAEVAAAEMPPTS